MGASQSLLTSLAVIINQQYMHGSDNQVAIIQAASMAGLLLSLLYTQVSQHLSLIRVYTVPHYFAWLCLLLAPFVPQGYFALIIFITAMCLHIPSPILPVIYQHIYPPGDRGKVVASTRQWQMLTVMLVGWLASYLIEAEPNTFKWLYPSMALLGVIACLSFSRISIKQFQYTQSKQKFSDYFLILRRDRNFVLFMVFQFMLGLSNIAGVAMLSLYVNDPKYQLLSPSNAMLILTVLPTLSMFLSYKTWGYLFDRMDIVYFRALASAIIGCGFLCYPWFGFAGLVVGCIIWGIGRAGGQLAWTIGILPFSRPETARQYVAIHTFLTGLRGVLAPFIGIFLLNTQFSTSVLFAIIGLMILSSALLTLLFVKSPKTDSD